MAFGEPGTWGYTGWGSPGLEDFPAPIVPGQSGTWGGTQSWGRWNPLIGHTPFSQPKKKKKVLGGAKLAQQNTMQSYMDMLNKQQQGVLQQMLDDAQKQRSGQLASLAGFGAALQGYSHDLWGQTDESYRNAAAAQQSMAQGLGGQVGSGVAEARAQEAALAGSLGHTGAPVDMPTAEAAAAQVGSEGGAKTGEMMGAVGTAWGGYGATRPEYIGFMTGQNQMQLEREGLQGDKDIRLEFAKLAMDNPKTAQSMYLANEENKRQTLSTSLAQQTLMQNAQIKKAQLQQQWYTARANAKDDAARRRIDSIYKAATIQNDQIMAGISQQRADASTISANASATSAAASKARAAETARNNAWKRAHPNATGTPPKYATGSWNEKVASAMYNTPGLFKDSGATKPQQRADYAFSVLWPQMATYIPKKQQAAAKAVLRQRLINAARKYVPKKSGSGAPDYGVTGIG